MTIPKLRFSQNILLCVIFSIIQVFIIHKSEIVYVPLLFIVLFSLLYGLLEPKRGWILALLQIAILISAYWILDSAGYVANRPYEAAFVTHVSFFPSLVAGFITSFLFKPS